MLTLLCNRNKLKPKLTKSAAQKALAILKYHYAEPASFK